MLFISHALFAILFFLLSQPYWPPISSLQTLGLFALVLFGAALPDIDEAHSTINKATGPFGKIISLLARHRGFFHSLLFFIPITILLAVFLAPLWAAAFLLGYAAHLIGDCLTPQGIMIFYPLSRPRLHGFIKTGGIIEKIIQVVLFVGIIFILIKN